MATAGAGGPPSSTVLTVEVHAHVATVWLDRPEARNAMGPELFTDLPVALDHLGTDDDVRAVVIAARGPHFCVGLDLRSGILGAAAGGDEAGRSPRSTGGQAVRARREVLRLQASISAPARCPKPVVAAVHGYCIGGGVDLITACDIRLASADARFSVRETRMAIVADLGSLQRLPRLIGMGHVAELAFTGADIDAARAREIGLVNAVLPDAEATVEAARALASEIAANPPLAVQGTKAVLAAGDGRTVEEGLDYVATWNAGALPTSDLAEAVAAFSEKRPPHFTGD